MIKLVFGVIFIFKIALIWSKEEELPLCPTNVLYFPQNLPMHCRMPTNADFPGIASALPPNPQNPPSNKNSPQPMPIPFPPGFAGPMPNPGAMPIPGAMAIPGQMPIPGPMPFPGPMAMPGPIGPSGPMPFPGPMPLSPGPAQKLPVIVMPFYSPDPAFKKGKGAAYTQKSGRPIKYKIRHRRRKPAFYSPDKSSSIDADDSSGSSSHSSSEYQGWWKGKGRSHRRFSEANRAKKKRHYQKRQLLTPVLQYVTKDGYVIFEKKITKTEAKDWLNVKKDEKVEISTHVSPEVRDMESSEPNDVHIKEKDTITMDNVEIITKRNPHRPNRVKVHGEKPPRRNHMDRSH